MSKYVQDDEWGTKYPNFKKVEFKCKCGKCDGYGNGIAKSLVENLQVLRNKYGAINISSGYRCVAKNKLVGGSNGSKHLQGLACDFYFQSGITANQTKRVAMVNEIKGMPNYRWSYCNVNGNYPNMGLAIHMDTFLVDYPDKIKQVEVPFDKKIETVTETNTDRPISNEINKNDEILKEVETTDYEDNKDLNNPLLHLIDLIVRLIKIIFKK